MKIIISDDDEILNNIKVDKNCIVIKNIDEVKYCIGCFSCWIKSPMHCIREDKICNISKELLKVDEIVIITRIFYGCYSYKIKRFIERIIGYVKPDFVIRYKELHHKTRTDKKIGVKIIVYNNISKLSKDIFERLCNRNMKNFNSLEYNIKYLNKDIKLIEENI